MRKSFAIRRITIAAVMLTLLSAIFLSSRNRMIPVIDAPGIDSFYGYTWSSPSEITYLRRNMHLDFDLVTTNVKNQQERIVHPLRGTIGKLARDVDWIKISPDVRRLLVVSPRKELKYRIFPAGDDEHAMRVDTGGRVQDCGWTSDERWLRLERSDDGAYLDWFALDKPLTRVEIPSSSREILGVYENDVVRILEGDVARYRKTYDVSTVHLNDSSHKVSTIRLNTPEPCEWWDVYGIPPCPKLLYVTTLYEPKRSFQLRNGWIPSLSRRYVLVSNLWLADLEGKHPRKILHFENEDGVAPSRFSMVPNSSQVSFSYNDKVWKVDVD